MDITELRELQRKLEKRVDMSNSALEATKYANVAKSDFLSCMSHDIRTPMNVITGMAEVVAAHIGDQDRAKDCLWKIRLPSHHPLGLINSALGMSKVENGNFSISMVPMRLPDELQEIIAIVSPGIRRMDQGFDVYLEGPGWENFMSGALRFCQILLNLPSNAPKFTPKDGRITLKIEIRETESVKKAMICSAVSDNGIGMSPEYLGQILEPFTHERDSRIDRVEGSGLRMAITKRLIDLLGGTITVKSQLGVGTVFDVLMPIDVLADSEEEQKDFRGLHILLVDDGPVQQARADSLLRSMGMEVEHTDFEEAGKRFLTHWGIENFGFITLGLSLAEAEYMEKTEMTCRGIHGGVLLAVSAYGVSGMKERAMTWGVCGFVSRPLCRSRVTDCMNRRWIGEELMRPDTKLVRLEKKPGQPDTEPLDLAGSQVLLVEDNELNHEIALELLGGFGVRLEATVNGREVPKRLGGSRPRCYPLILTDIQMPVMNGYEAVCVIRSLSREDAKTVPILAMTADTFVEDIENTKVVDMNGYLVKPLDPRQLVREIGQYPHV